MEGHFSYLSYSLTPSVLWIGHFGRNNCYQDKNGPSHDKDDQSEQFYNELVQLKILRGLVVPKYARKITLQKKE